uniref:Uncharacterized protein n=1 Tax=Kalanchoe fedtschenkoi TaxID=63787 RepID=A0A7N0ZTL0_KALFE
MNEIVGECNRERDFGTCYRQIARYRFTFAQRVRPEKCTKSSKQTYPCRTQITNARVVSEYRSSPQPQTNDMKRTSFI